MAGLPVCEGWFVRANPISFVIPRRSNFSAGDWFANGVVKE